MLLLGIAFIISAAAWKSSSYSLRKAQRIPVSALLCSRCTACRRMSFGATEPRLADTMHGTPAGRTWKFDESVPCTIALKMSKAEPW